MHRRTFHSEEGMWKQLHGPLCHLHGTCTVCFKRKIFAVMTGAAAGAIETKARCCDSGSAARMVGSSASVYRVVL